MTRPRPNGRTASLTLVDRLIVAFDSGIRTIAAPAHSTRAHPDAAVADPELSDSQRRLSAALMRVNHTGEVCAQALYQGQALTARDADVRAILEDAAREETDHLAWTEQRIAELGGSKSVLNPAFFAGSFLLGAVSGLAGDRWNLGFLAETERQVEGHLEDHLSRLPAEDAKSRTIVTEMREDEARHARTATEHGGAELPAPLRAAMKLASRIMTRSTYYV
ncbi:MAG: 2-polyprenyl-3-methyl-6-methoxy-1,4-benzoquinone monooxygenase [Betaproteobacteria bacterium]|nr:2-polyprenyl-3-methyl-6-methoxy-1,4-benzoquinone monooxygenase [Betaproteobacteria bacterium]